MPRLLGWILIATVLLWIVAINLGFWPYLLAFAVICFIGLSAFMASQREL